MNPIDPATGDVRVDIVTPLPLSVSGEILAAFGARWPGTMIEPAHNALRLRIPAAEVHKSLPDPAGPVEPVEHVGYLDTDEKGNLNVTGAQHATHALVEALAPLAEVLLSDAAAQVGGAVNYLSIDLRPHDVEVSEYVQVVVQRMAGLSPAAKATRLVEAINDLRADLENDGDDSREAILAWVEETLRSVGSTTG